MGCLGNASPVAFEALFGDEGRTRSEGRLGRVRVEI